jgi:hypothetical protein
MMRISGGMNCLEFWIDAIVYWMTFSSAQTCAEPTNLPQGLVSYHGSRHTCRDARDAAVSIIHHAKQLILFRPRSSFASLAWT